MRPASQCVGCGKTGMDLLDRIERYLTKDQRLGKICDSFNKKRQ